LSLAQNAPSATDREVIFWKTIENSKNPGDFRVYLKTYPSGIYVPLAQARVREALEQFVTDPVSPEKLPSLPVTMQYIQDNLNRIGWVSHHYDNGDQSYRVSEAVADPSLCRLSYRTMEIFNGNSDTTSTFYFREVESVLYHHTPGFPPVARGTMKSGGTMVTTHSVATGQTGRSDYNSNLPSFGFGFQDEDSAQHMVRALNHAVDLCARTR
jgi:hypothetical protein